MGQRDKITIAAVTMFWLLIVVIGILAFCRTPEIPTTPTPTLSISATPSDTPEPPTATATPTLAPPSPTVGPTNTVTLFPPSETGTAVPTDTAVPTEEPTGTPATEPTVTPQLAVTVGSVHDTLWYLAWRYCEDANLWGNLQRASEIKNPRWMRLGDRVELRCK